MTGAAGRSRSAAGTRPGDGGSGSVLVLGVMGLVCVFGIVLMVAGGVRATRHRAGSAADSAALAAAAHAGEGSPAACAFAARVARGTGARLVACSLGGGPSDTGSGADGRDPAFGNETSQVADVTVIATYRGPEGVGTLRIRARSRAGPARSAPYPARGP